MRSRTWDASRYSATKEVFAFAKLETLSTTFAHCCVLYRHRQHTFPTSRPDYLTDFYRSLELWDTGVGVLDEWKTLFPSTQVSVVLS